MQIIPFYNNIIEKYVYQNNEFYNRNSQKSFQNNIKIDILKLAL